MLAFIMLGILIIVDIISTLRVWYRLKLLDSDLHEQNTLIKSIVNPDNIIKEPEKPKEKEVEDGIHITPESTKVETY